MIWERVAIYVYKSFRVTRPMSNYPQHVITAYNSDPQKKRFSIENWVNFGFARSVAPELYGEPKKLADNAVVRDDSVTVWYAKFCHHTALTLSNSPDKSNDKRWMIHVLSECLSSKHLYTTADGNYRVWWGKHNVANCSRYFTRWSISIYIYLQGYHHIHSHHKLEAHLLKWPGYSRMLKKTERSRRGSVSSSDSGTDDDADVPEIDGSLSVKKMPALEPLVSKPMPALEPLESKPTPALEPLVSKPMPGLNRRKVNESISVRLYRERIEQAASKNSPVSSKTMPSLVPISTSSKTMPALEPISTSSKNMPALEPISASSKTMPALEPISTWSKTTPALEPISTLPNTMPALSPIQAVSQPSGNITNFMRLLVVYQETCSRELFVGATIFAPTNVALSNGAVNMLCSGPINTLKAYVEKYMSVGTPTQSTDGTTRFLMMSGVDVHVKTDRTIEGYPGSILKTLIRPECPESVVMTHTNIF